MVYVVIVFVLFGYVLDFLDKKKRDKVDKKVKEDLLLKNEAEKQNAVYHRFL